MKTFTGLCWGLTITFLLMAVINVIAIPEATALVPLAS